MDLDFEITFEGFGDGLAPLAHIDTKNFTGSKGQALEMKADIISNPGFLQQSPALTNLTNGTQSGVVTELIRFILDKPTAASITYAVGTSKLFKLTPTTVVSGGSPSWPQTISGMTEGESVIRLKEFLYVFYNKSSGGDIAIMPLSSESITANWGSSNDLALEKAPHPSAAKEDILVFGNGRYVGTYIQAEALLNTQKLDFGEGAEVADVVFSSGLWWIAVNYGEGRSSNIFLYDGSAISNALSDEVGPGLQKIGFLYVLNGVIYVAYGDLTANNYAIAWISGRQIKPLRYFSGSLPNHRQKTLYKNTILTISGENVLSFGTQVEQLPIQISNLADGGYATVGAIAAPFGTPLVSSTDGGSNYRLAKFSGLSTDSNWKSILVDMTKGRYLGKINTVIVLTKRLGTGARADLKLATDQGETLSSALVVTGQNKSRHVFRTIDLLPGEDLQVLVDYQNGSSSVSCPIRKIICQGNFIEG